MAKTGNLSATKKENIHKLIALIRSQGIRISKVILFGSYAKGKATTDSDIDLAIVSTQFGKDTIGEMMMLKKLAINIDTQLEPLPMSPLSFKDKYSTLSSEIRRHGISVV